MTTFFDAINVSAPHIYHSALPLSPQTSIIRGRYNQHASPFVRVVHGVPVSWQPTTATAYIDDGPKPFAWSPCNRFIAVAKVGSVEVLDAVTLSSLSTFEYYFKAPYRLPCFSPDSRHLSQLGGGNLISWDLQTGAPRGVISGNYSDLSSTHSNDGKMIAVAGEGFSDYSFSNYDLLSGTCVGPRDALKGKIVYPIWTHDEHFRFGTVNRDSIRIWKSPFTLRDPPVEVESLPVPDEIGNARDFLFLPALSRLAFILKGSIQIWDAKASKLLLESEFKQRGVTFIPNPPNSSFSSDGRFFASANYDSEVHVWKESPTGYVIHQRLQFFNKLSRPQFSPNGESIVVSLPSMLHRWRTRDQALSLPSISTENTNCSPFILGFSPDEKFAVFVRRKGNVVIILDLRSGEQRWITDMGVKIDCLGMTEDTVVVVGQEKIATWDLPGGDCALHTSVNNGVRFTNLTLPRIKGPPIRMSISPNLSHIVIARESTAWEGIFSLEVDDVPTGRRLAWTESKHGMTLLFTQDGHEAWARRDGSFGEQSKIIEDSKSGTIELNLQIDEGPSAVILRESPHGHEITDGGWVLSPTRKRLLWLPHHWRLHSKNRVWGGRFLGLLNHDLPEVVILEFLE